MLSVPLLILGSVIFNKLKYEKKVFFVKKKGQVIGLYLQDIGETA